MHPLIEWTAAALIVIAAFFLLVGAIGLARLPDFFMRLHAPTKASTLGVGGVLLASMLVAFSQGRPGIAELLITLFVFVTAPVSANLCARRRPGARPRPSLPGRHPVAPVRQRLAHGRSRGQSRRKRPGARIR